MARLRRLIRCTGILLVAAGALLSAFWCYLQWGTGLAEHGAQVRLGAELDQRRPEVSRSRRIRSAALGPYGWPALPDGAPLARILIPAIGVDQVVVQGTDTADLREGPGHYAATPYPGQDGNVAIAGHRTTYAHPFFDLNELRPGDVIELSVPDDTWDYRVTGSMVVSPGDVAVAGPLGEPGGWLTLTTCNPRYSAATRLVVRAELAGAVAPAMPPAPGPAPTHPVGASRPGSVPRQRPAGWRPRQRPAGWESTARPITGWALALVGVVVAGGLVVRRRRRPAARAAALLSTGLVALLVLFELFGAVAGHLPSGF
ncbi:MAG TPA: class E sortase [Acidimicrobiales bacterium]|nr:class E sortase [Acidimicrobiales bacterium]